MYDSQHEYLQSKKLDRDAETEVQDTNHATTDSSSRRVHTTAHTMNKHNLHHDRFV